MKWLQFVVIGVVLVLSGCVTTSKESNPWLYPPMVVPLQPTFKEEMRIIRLNQLLSQPNLNDDVKAKIFFERGHRYDGLGLRELAHLDFKRSLKLNPAQPDIFHLLGINLTQAAYYDAAYDAFDSALELDPNNQSTRRSRAIALYYGDRIDLSYEEMWSYYRNKPEDPFRVLWLYMVEHEIDPQRAKANLKARYVKNNQQWGWALIAIILGEISEKQLFEAVLHDAKNDVVLAQRLTETYFYLGKQCQLTGRYNDAIAFYKLALSFNVYDYIEHKYSLLELDRIFAGKYSTTKAGE